MFFNQFIKYIKRYRILWGLIVLFYVFFLLVLFTSLFHNTIGDLVLKAWSQIIFLWIPIMLFLLGKMHVYRLVLFIPVLSLLQVVFILPIMLQDIGFESTIIFMFIGSMLIVFYWLHFYHIGYAFGIPSIVKRRIIIIFSIFSIVFCCICWFSFILYILLGHRTLVT